MGEQHRYRVGKLIASGATGEVYRGEFLSAAGIRRPVAIKLLKVGIEHQEEVAARLRDEARMIARVRHPSIVRVEDLSTLEGRLAVILEYVDGADLGAIRDRYGALPPRAVAELLCAVAGALREAHRAPGPDGQPMHIVHRDIKPENIALDVFGEVKVLDFGAARARFEGREAQTTDHVPGTLPYLSPERFLDDDESIFGSPASDLWALGATAVELAVGQRWTEVRKRRRRASPRDSALEAMREARVPEPLVALLWALLADSPEERPTADEVVEQSAELSEALPGRGLRSTARAIIEQVRGDEPETPDSREGVVLVASPDPTEGLPAPTPPERPRLEAGPPREAGPPPEVGPPPGAGRRRLPLLGAALLLLLGLAWGLWPRGAGESPAAPEAPSGEPEVGDLPPEDPPADPPKDPPADPEIPPAEDPHDPSKPESPPPKPGPPVSKPAADEPPKPKPPTPMGTVVLKGDDTLQQAWLDPGHRTLTRGSQAVPAGTYALQARFAWGDIARTLEVRADAEVVLKCYTNDCRITR